MRACTLAASSLQHPAWEAQLNPFCSKCSQCPQWGQTSSSGFPLLRRMCWEGQETERGGVAAIPVLLGSAELICAETSFTLGRKLMSCQDKTILFQYRLQSYGFFSISYIAYSPFLFPPPTSFLETSTVPCTTADGLQEPGASSRSPLKAWRLRGRKGFRACSKPWTVLDAEHRVQEGSWSTDVWLWLGGMTFCQVSFL